MGLVRHAVPSFDLAHAYFDCLDALVRVEAGDKRVRFGDRGAFGGGDPVGQMPAGLVADHVRIGGHDLPSAVGSGLRA